VVWAELADPGETRLTIAEGDPTTENLDILLTAWQCADPDRHGLTAAGFLKLVQDTEESCPAWAADGRAALDVLLDKLDARHLGTMLRTYRRRIVGGRFFDKAGERQRSARWAVYPAGEFRDRPEHTHHTHHTHGPADGPGECGECGECVPADSRTKADVDSDSDGLADAWELPADRKPGDNSDHGRGPYADRW
jgi:hypothetical protein